MLIIRSQRRGTADAAQAIAHALQLPDHLVGALVAILATQEALGDEVVLGWWHGMQPGA